MLYFFLKTYSPKLTTALMYSIAIAYFVYFMMGGRILCDESPIIPSDPIPKTDVPPAQNGVKVTGLKCQSSLQIPNPPGCTED